MRSNIKLGRVFGITIGLHFSWFLIALLIVFSLSSQFHATNPEWGDGEILVLSIVTAILFFVSLLLHELAHSLVATRNGLPVREITLFALGGVSQIEKNPTSAKIEFWMAFVGPLTSAVIGGICLAAASLLGGPSASPGGAMLFWLGYINLTLALFNMVPGYPLDGGRVLHAFVWRWTKDRFRATQIAASVGRVMAILFIAFGAFSTLYSGVGIGNGLWLIFIGWFLLQAGGAERMQAELLQSLAGLSARDIAVAAPPPLSADATADVALQTMLKNGSRALPVMLGDQLLGIITMGDFAKLQDRAPADAYVTSLMTRTDDLKSAPPAATAVEVVRSLLRNGVGQIPVIDESGTLLGFVTRDSVLRRLGLPKGYEGASRAA